MSNKGIFFTKGENPMLDGTLSIINTAINADQTVTPAERKKILAALNPTQLEKVKLLTTRETCEVLGITRRTLHSWDLQGRAHAIRRSSRCIRYLESEILRLATEGDPNLESERGRE